MAGFVQLLHTEAAHRNLLEPGALVDAPIAFRLVRDMRYQRASDRRPETIIKEWRGTCSGKHYLLHALFTELGLEAQVMACSAITPVSAEHVPESVRPLYEAANRRFVDIHNYLLVHLGNDKHMIVDATWPLPARQHGRVVNEHFVLGQDHELAAKPIQTWPVPAGQDPQDFKDELLHAHFTPAELEFRELVIHTLSS